MTIQSILLEYLGDGALPVYETAPDVNYYVLEFGDALDLYTGEGRWMPKLNRQNRIIVPTSIDTDNLAVIPRVGEWVAAAQNLPGQGTLIFPMRSHMLEDGTVLVIAGMAYSDRAINGALPLHEDPTELIRALLRNDTTNPYIREVRERRDAEIREHQRYDLMAKEIRRVEAKKAKKAEKRAAKLLDGQLTHKQRRELAKKKHFHVRGQDGRLYQITDHTHQNVFLIEDGRRTMQFCAVSSERVPVPDLLLAQKLLIEHNTEHFLSVANKWEVRLADGRVVRDRVIDTLLDRLDRNYVFRQALNDAVGRLERAPIPERIVPGFEIREVADRDREVIRAPIPPPMPELGIAV